MRNNMIMVTKEENKIMAEAMKKLGMAALYGEYAQDGTFKCLDIMTKEELISQLSEVTVSSIVQFVVNVNRQLYVA